MTARVHAVGDLLIDRYLVSNYIDEGGMQQVYSATDRMFDRQVALKVPKSASAEKRFERSAKVSARVIHANVAATLDYFEFQSRSYLIEELIDGSDLGDRLHSEFSILDPHLAAHLIHNVT